MKVVFLKDVKGKFERVVAINNRIAELKETLEKITVKEDKEKFINWVMLIFKPGGDREMDEQAPEITKILKKYFPNMKEINI